MTTFKFNLQQADYLRALLQARIDTLTPGDNDERAELEIAETILSDMIGDDTKYG